MSPCQPQHAIHKRLLYSRRGNRLDTHAATCQQHTSTIFLPFGTQARWLYDPLRCKSCGKATPHSAPVTESAASGSTMPFSLSLSSRSSIGSAPSGHALVLVSSQTVSRPSCQVMVQVSVTVIVMVCRMIGSMAPAYATGAEYRSVFQAKSTQNLSVAVLRPRLLWIRRFGALCHLRPPLVPCSGSCASGPA